MNYQLSTNANFASRSNDAPCCAEAHRLGTLVESARRAIRIGLGSRDVLRAREASYQRHLASNCVQSLMESRAMRRSA